MTFPAYLLRLASPVGSASNTVILQVTRLQYLNALLATRAQNLPQSPENTDLQVMPGSQTRLLGEKTATAAGERRVARRARCLDLRAVSSHTQTCTFAAYPALCLFSLFSDRKSVV